MKKKISDKDKEDWKNFLSNKVTTQNKNIINKKVYSDPKKNQEDWKSFLTSKEKLPNKDLIHKTNIRHKKVRKIDFHGYSIKEANIAIEQFIKKSFEESVTKIIVVTGKGMRSKSSENPYLSKDLSLLKYSVPEYIKSNKNLTQLIIETTDAKIEDGGSGAFYIYLKNKNKINK